MHSKLTQFQTLQGQKVFHTTDRFYFIGIFVMKVNKS